LAAGAEVTGPTENCQSSEEIKARLREWVLDHRPNVVHLNCGLHDLRRDPGAEGSRITLADYSANLEQIFASLTAARVGTLVWATTTPIDEARHQARRPSQRAESDFVAYNSAAEAVAKRFGLVVNDLYGAVVAAGKAMLLADDSVHFTPRGYELLAHHVGLAIGRA
jgi:lysophospholipase L1-like esterase